MQDVVSLCDEIDRNKLSLKIAFDVPQIYTAHNASREAQYIYLLEKAKTVRQYIGGVHLWGKNLSATGKKVSHCGNLNTCFNDSAVKESFLSAFCDCFNDGITRKMVLEVNSGNDDLISIVSDLQNAGVTFN